MANVMLEIFDVFQIFFRMNSDALTGVNEHIHVVGIPNQTLLIIFLFTLECVN